MGFRIIVYNNIITKFYTFQAERERVLLKSCTILISTHNWGRSRGRGRGREGGCKYVCSDTLTEAPDTIFQYLRQPLLRAQSSLISAPLLVLQLQFSRDLCWQWLFNVYQFSKGPFVAIAYTSNFEPCLPLDFKGVLAYFYSWWRI